jgi:hypothetical protein
MPKSLKDILNGVNKSKVEPLSTGKDPGVDYAPKAPNEQEFLKKHTVQKHADRVGNTDSPYTAPYIKHALAKPEEKRHGYKKPEDKKVNEAAQCNMTAEGTYCPVHEMASCSGKKTLKEIIKKPISERTLSSTEMEKREKYVKGMKKKGADFEKRYPGRGKEVMYATATKMAKEETEGFNTGASNGSGSADIDESLAFPLLGGADGDESAEMAKTQLRALANKAMHLAMQLNDDQVVEPWVQAKIAVAKDHVTAVHDYMIYGNHSNDKEEDEQTAPYDGGIDPSSGTVRNTFPNFSVDVNTGRNV